MWCIYAFWTSKFVIREPRPNYMIPAMTFFVPVRTMTEFMLQSVHGLAMAVSPFWLWWGVGPCSVWWAVRATDSWVVPIARFMSDKICSDQRASDRPNSTRNKFGWNWHCQQTLEVLLVLWQLTLMSLMQLMGQHEIWCENCRGPHLYETSQ